MQKVATAAAGSVSVSDPAARGSRGSLWGGSGTLWRRDLVRFFRQRNRVVGALATPVVFWLLLGSGLDRTFQMAVPVTESGAGESMGYLAYFFPGALVLILLFTAIFSTFSVIEDRREGFLQAVLVAPVPRLAIVMGKVLGGATIATIQGAVFLGLGLMMWGWPGFGTLVAVVGVMFALAVGLTALALCLAWPMDSTAGFHAVMNLLLMPMWFLSGAVFPLSTAPGWLAAIMYVNPLTYGHSAFVGVLHGTESPALAAPLPAALGVTLAGAFVAVSLAGWLVTRPRAEGV